MTNFSLNHRIALITGASRGIGEAIAMTLAEHGAHCILVSRKQEQLDITAEKIRQNNGKADAIACQMGNLNDISHLMETISSKYGKLDILVNNAATNPYFGEMMNAEESAWDKTFAVNLKGPFFLIQAAAKLMKQNKTGGSIINISSVNGVRPAFYQGIYSITKAGLISMTQAYSKELVKYKIRVNAVLPGFTDTNFTSVIKSDKEISDYVISQIPMRRMAAPEEMTGAVLYLASDASSYTTGSCIVCDGGLLA